MAITISISYLAGLSSMTFNINSGTGNITTSVKVWTESTFKNLASAVDLSSSIDGSDNTETITVTPADLGQSELSGIYYVEVENNNDETQLSHIAFLNKWKKCLADKTLQHIYDHNCSKSSQIEALNIEIFINGINSALFLDYYVEANTMIDNLKKLCSKDCEDCPELKYIS